MAAIVREFGPGVRANDAKASKQAGL